MKMCRCCGKRYAAGYVVRHGIYLDKLCVKCWKKGDVEGENKRNYQPGSFKRGKS
jgi:hypothetical protein